jgi:hypothetical protein
LTKQSTLVEFVILPEKHLIIERFFGDIDLEMIKRMTQVLWNQPNYSKDFNGLVDLREAEFILTPLDLIRLAQYFFSNRQTSTGFIVILSRNTQTIANS